MTVLEWLGDKIEYKIKYHNLNCAGQKDLVLELKEYTSTQCGRHISLSSFIIVIGVPSVRGVMGEGEGKEKFINFCFSILFSFHHFQLFRTFYYLAICLYIYVYYFYFLSTFHCILIFWIFRSFFVIFFEFYPIYPILAIFAYFC